MFPGQPSHQPSASPLDQPAGGALVQEGGITEPQRRGVQQGWGGRHDPAHFCPPGPTPGFPWYLALQAPSHFLH